MLVWRWQGYDASGTTAPDADRLYEEQDWRLRAVKPGPGRPPGTETDHHLWQIQTGKQSKLLKIQEGYYLFH